MYCMAWNVRRNQIVAAVDSTVQVFNMRDPGNFMNKKKINDLLAHSTLLVL